MRRSPRQEGHAVEKLPFVEGLRGLAALYVVLGHFCSMADGSALAGKASQAPDWVQRLMAPFAYGHLAVAAFIVLSGFCLQLSLFASRDGRITDMRRFFLRRARRILPAYYACLAFSLLVALTVTVRQTGMPFEHYLPVTTENVLAHVFLIHNLSPDWMYKINGVLWSISIEVQLYLLFPLLVASMLRFGRPAFLILCAAAAAAVIAYVPTAPKLYPWYLPLFGAGMVAAHFAFRPSLHLGPVPRLATLMAAGALGASIYTSSAGAALYVRDAWFGVFVAATIYAATVSPSIRFGRMLSTRPLVALGGFSYSLYLMHHPIQQVLYAWRPAYVQGEAWVLGYLVVAALPVILLACYLFSLVFERPFMSRHVVAPSLPTEPAWAPATLPLRAAGRIDRLPPATPAREPSPARQESPVGGYALAER
jgi:peptidoglycan/LPS O-acetylase OafA/YrhL